MSDDFDRYLQEFRSRINQGGLQQLKQDLAAGRIARDAKVRAANFAIEEAENIAASTFVLPLPPDSSSVDNLISFWKAHWQFIITTVLGITALIIAYFELQKPS